MSTTREARAWVEIRADALEENYARVRRAVGPEAGLLPMVKADAYGLGAREVVGVLDPLEPWGYGVATVEEGIALRVLGVERPILVCSPVPFGEIERAVQSELHLSVSTSIRGWGAAASTGGVSTSGYPRSVRSWKAA
jgi:alanine racemase